MARWLITGCSTGIGREIARAALEAGHSVVVTARRVESVADFTDEYGDLAVTVALDVTDKEQIATAVRTATDAFGGIDVLVNNAQQVPMGKLAQVTDEAFELGFRSGPLAALRLMKLVQPSMAERGGGTIFNLVSSAGVRWDMSGYGAYGSIKQAMRPLTRAAAAEWGTDNIRVLSIAPHAKSPGLKGWIENNPEEAEAFFRTIPLRRVGECEEDIGQAVVALCQPELGYLTGATIPLDGGQANFD